MTPAALEILTICIPILTVSGVFVLVGLKGWSNHKLRMREAPGGDNKRLAETVQQLHDEFGSMREDVAELQERVYFTERVLSEVRSRKVVGPGDST